MLEVTGEAAADDCARQEAHERDHGCRHVDNALSCEPEAEEDDVAGHVGHEDVAEDEHADRVDDAGSERQQQQAVTVNRAETGEVRGMCLPYSCGVRSSVVIVVIRVIRQSERSRFISSRYDRYRSDGMFFDTGLVETELV